MFLKKPERIEVLGPILRMALLIWDLIEHLLRQHVLENNVELPGWDNNKTRRPTACMMSAMFAGLQIVRFGVICRLPLTDIQCQYLQALGLKQQHILSPYPPSGYG